MQTANTKVLILAFEYSFDFKMNSTNISEALNKDHKFIALI